MAEQGSRCETMIAPDLRAWQENSNVIHNKK